MARRRGWDSSWPEEIFNALDVGTSAYERESLAQRGGPLAGCHAAGDQLTGSL